MVTHHAQDMGHWIFLNENDVKISLTIEVRMFYVGIMPMDVYIDNDNEVYSWSQVETKAPWTLLQFTKYIFSKKTFQLVVIETQYMLCYNYTF